MLRYQFRFYCRSRIDKMSWLRLRESNIQPEVYLNPALRKVVVEKEALQQKCVLTPGIIVSQKSLRTFSHSSGCSGAVSGADLIRYPGSTDGKTFL